MSNAESTVTRLRIARENEDIVLAEGALEAERVVSRVRVALVLAIALAGWCQSMFSHRSLPADPVRTAVAAGYLAFALIIAGYLRRATPSVRGAELGPLALTITDFGALTFFHVRTFHATHHTLVGIVAAVYAVLLCFSVGRRHGWHVAISCACACGCFAGVVLSEDPGPSALPEAAVVGACYAALALLVGTTGRRTRRMFLGLRRRENLSRFVPQAVVDRIVRFGEAALEPAQREVTILFSDIRGFTSLSEQLPPRVVLELLDGYFADMSQIVHGHGGMVAKLIGDGMLAVWGAPERLEDHASPALAAALDMRVKLAERNAERARLGHPPLRIGIGIHSGTVAAGLLGGAEQHEYTVIGDAVNVASRVEGLTKEHRADILVTEVAWRMAAGRFEGGRVGEAHVKGREQPVIIYRLDGRAPAAARAVG